MIPIYDDIPQAQATILRRAAWDEQQIPAPVLDGIERIFGQRLTPEQAVATVLADVRQRGDAAVLEWSQRIDGPHPRGASSAAYRDPLAVPQAEIDAAVVGLDPALLDALKLAAQRLEVFHRQQPTGSWMDVTPGGVLGQIVRPYSGWASTRRPAPRRCPRRCCIAPFPRAWPASARSSSARRQTAVQAGWRR